MKKFLFILLLFVCHFAQSQTVPQGINYQAVALDQSGQPIPGIDIVGRPIDDAEIGVRISILENAPTGNVLYEEEHEVLTDLYGMFNLVIGQGLQVSVNPFSSINWQGDKFLQVELSIENDGEFVLSAVQQLMSVPYAFLAENAIVAQTAVDVDDADADPSNELQSLGVSGDSLTLSSGNTVQLPAIDDADADPNNEIQVLSISNDTLFLSNGGFAVLPVDQVNDADADPSNEIQTLSKSGTTISLTNGGSVTVFDGDYNNLSNTPTIPTKTSDLTNDSGFITAEGDSSTTNELQALSISNDTIYLTSGGYVVLPAGFDGDYTSLTNTPAIPTKTSDLTNDSGFITAEGDSSTTNELQSLSLSNDTLRLSNGGGEIFLSSNNNSGLSIQQKLDNGITPWQLLNEGVLKSSIYGKNYQGGIIIYLNDTTLSGMVITDGNIAENICPPSNYGVTQTSEQIGTGLSNSIALNWPDAAGACLSLVRNGYDDWFLPSSKELLNAAQNVPGWGTGGRRLYSSTVETVSIFTYVKILNGNAIANNLSNCTGYDVRAVRVFSNANTQNNLQYSLSTDDDLDSTNELQTLSISNDTLFLSNGGFVKLPNSVSSTSSSQLYKTVINESSGALTIPTGTTDSVTTTFNSPRTTLIVKTFPGGSNLQFNTLVSRIRLFNSNGDPVEFYFEETYYRKSVSNNSNHTHNDQVNIYYGNKTGPLPTISRNFDLDDNANSGTVRYNQVKIIPKEAANSCRILFSNANSNGNFANSITGNYEIQSIE